MDAALTVENYPDRYVQTFDGVSPGNDSGRRGRT
jgi:hypothetical protein